MPNQTNEQSTFKTFTKSNGTNNQSDIHDKSTRQLEDYTQTHTDVENEQNEAEKASKQTERKVNRIIEPQSIEQVENADLQPFSYDLDWSEKDDTNAIYHRVKTEEATVALLKELPTRYLTYYAPETSTESTVPAEHSTFGEAISTLLECLEQGIKPTNAINYWDYEGYAGNATDSFRTYLDPSSTDRQKEIAPHKFTNQRSNIRVKIHTGIARIEHDKEKPITYLTVINIDTEEKLTQETFPGQKQAFNRLVTLLGNTTSSRLKNALSPIE